MEKTIKESPYTQGMFYEVRMLSRYLTLAGNTAFGKLNLDISFEEYIILDTIAYNNGICHIDLAKMLLRDRSNTGKIISDLEKFNYVRIKADIRNNRTVKKIYITKSGQKACNEIYLKIKPFIESFNDKFPKEQQNIIADYMKQCRQILEHIAQVEV